MHIVFIHGHRATARSFSFVASKLPEYRHIFLEYDSERGFFANHRRLLAELEGVDDIFFVAHSLGGLHALHLAQELGERVRGAVTISTPYGGSEAAALLSYMMPFNPVYQDIRPTGAPVMLSRQFDVPCAWTNIVSMKGHTPLMAAANDGVVTIESMRSRNDIRLVEIDTNHFEVLLSDAAVDIIRAAIREVEPSALRVGD
ncbi:alpha/beta fold hydrolase [Oxalobacteraceae bacterium OM1]|nr:alpha/beta fold hydrolase [Oxalobacteraceae bacterium OM1]